LEEAPQNPVLNKAR